MFALLWQMEMKGSGPDGSACGDRAESGARSFCYHPHLLGEAKLEINSPGLQNAVSVPKQPSPFHLRIQGDRASTLAHYCFVRRGTCELWGQGLTYKTSAGLCGQVSSLVRHLQDAGENAPLQSPLRILELPQGWGTPRSPPGHF